MLCFIRGGLFLLLTAQLDVLMGQDNLIQIIWSWFEAQFYFMNDLSLYVISLSTYLCYLFKKLHSSDFYLDYKYLICQPTSVQMAYSTVTQMQKSQDSSLDQKFQFQACLSFIICSFFSAFFGVGVFLLIHLISIIGLLFMTFWVLAIYILNLL